MRIRWKFIYEADANTKVEFKVRKINKFRKKMWNNFQEMPRVGWSRAVWIMKENIVKKKRVRQLKYKKRDNIRKTRKAWNKAPQSISIGRHIGPDIIVKMAVIIQSGLYRTLLEKGPNLHQALVDCAGSSSKPFRWAVFMVLPHSMDRIFNMGTQGHSGNQFLQYIRHRSFL